MTDASFTCRVCSMTSHNPNDVREGYCGRCHNWTGRMTERELGAAIRELHDQYRPVFTDEYDICVYCSQRKVAQGGYVDSLAHVPWPCPTVRAFEAGEIR